MKERILIDELSEDWIDKIIINKELNDDNFIDKLNKKVHTIFKINLFKIVMEKWTVIANLLKLYGKDYYILPKYFFVKRIDEMISKSLLEKVILNIDSYLLINEKNEEVFLINPSIKRFLEKFYKPNQLINVVNNIKYGIFLNKEIDDTIMSFFLQMVYRKILVPVRENGKMGNKRNSRRFQNLDIIHVLKKNAIVTTAIAFDNKRKEKVVIKFLISDTNNIDEKTISVFQHEFYILDQVSPHPLIRSLISFEKENNLAILEYVNGRTLEELVLIGKLKIRHKLFLIYQIIESLSFLHERKIIHGDVHPNQFLVEPNLHIKLIDFGNSISDFEENVVTMKGGVYYCLEPENLTDNAFYPFKNYTPNFYIDVYRLGVVLYFLIYEKYPFNSFSWKELYKFICSQEVIFEYFVKNESVPLFLIAIIKKALSKNPEFRFQSVIEISTIFNEEYKEM
jgi:tRNA A-37 threonylcarbamoyl transferase component Bud32